MLESKIYTRRSVGRDSEYQIDCKIIIKGVRSKYRMRRGSRGTWTKWYTIRNMELLLWKFGFTQKPKLVNDFHFENYFGRGVIKLNDEMVKYLINTKENYGSYFYSFITPHNGSYWRMPVTAIKDKRSFNWLRRVIEENQ